MFVCLIWGLKTFWHAQMEANTKLSLKFLIISFHQCMIIHFNLGNSFIWHCSATVPLNVPVVFVHIFVYSSAEVAVHPIGLPTVEICNVFLDLLFIRFYEVSTKTTLEFRLASHWVSTAINVVQLRFFKWI